MKATFTATFEVDVTDWFQGEGMTKKQRIKKIEENLEDYSIFMQVDIEDTFYR